MESKDKSSRSGSRANLNESTLPLLEDVGGGDIKAADEAKEKIELELKGGDSGSKGEDSNAATAEPGSDAGGKEAGGESDAEAGKKDKKGKDKKKDKKEKKEKKASSHKRSPSCVETLTIGLNLLDRDEKHVNDSINGLAERYVKRHEMPVGVPRTGCPTRKTRRVGKKGSEVDTGNRRREPGDNFEFGP
ncbi:hypothetical protein HPB51_001254 [Rhipicephalus microplus]|uniref:Uncharacterized protein n=1 Tax=Rhipicephalus microplus TaxID=6941 RepID=A0A9J6E5Y8_RHIMP|nr:hypothetical protein HPB51_001254 [Rhipicephalus microplus]